MKPTASQGNACSWGNRHCMHNLFCLVAENAYGTVYRVHHKILNRTLPSKQDAEGNATNTYTSGIGGGPKDRHFSILQALKHPHILEIVSIFRGGTFRSTKYILVLRQFPLVKVASFGLATRISDDGLGCLFDLHGSPDYMSPKMLRQPRPAAIAPPRKRLRGVTTFPETETPDFRWDDLRERFDILHELLNPDPNLRYTLAVAL
ncbi:hypothetical protein R3P38DRAFT_3214958 [Favolaschia claudopus]|uniref:Protein kinase domain-containing protein n=1 Tax=Favolaschia claudopus TaxID=2862362 RepID=A0AAW0AB68_9AGAR